MIGPWSHGGGIGTELADAQIEWFTPLLQPDPATPPGPPIRVRPWSTTAVTGWHALHTWPPPGGESRTLYLDADPAGSHTSPGVLVDVAARAGSRALPVDPTITTGSTSRWANGYGALFGYPEMAEHDARCLTWTGPPTEGPTLLVGHPVVELFVRCPAPDLDVFVTLSQIDPDGLTEYISEGCLRATHRGAATDPPATGPDPSLDLPLRLSTAAALRPIEGSVRLKIVLHPVAVELAAGTRLRLAVAQADADNALSLPPVADAYLLFGPAHPSSLRITAYPAEALNAGEAA